MGRLEDESELYEIASDGLTVLRVNIIDQSGGAPATGDFFADEISNPMAVSPLSTNLPFGFTAKYMIIANDELTGGTAKDFEISFDGFSNVHGKVKKGEVIRFDLRKKTSIDIRGVGSARDYRIWAWC